MGPYEDCSPGDSTSDSSEKLFQKGRGKERICVILVKGDYLQSHTLLLLFFFLEKVSAGLVKLLQLSPGRILVLFKIGGDTRIGS